MLVLPGVRPSLRPGGEPFAVVRAGRTGRRRHDPGRRADRVAAALARPLLARHVLRDGAERVLVLPADAELRGPLEAIERGLDDHSVLLFPRLLGGLPQDGERPDSRDLLDAGEIDDELVAVRADDSGLAFVDWWVERRREDADAAAELDEPPSRLNASPLARRAARSRA